VSYSIRKPYYKLKQDTTSFFTAAVRHLKSAIVMAESQFEKPYADSDYHQMHLNLPTPDFIDGGGGSSQNKDCKGDCDFFIPFFACDEPIVFGVSANYCLAEFNEWLKASNYSEKERELLSNHWPDDIINLSTIVQVWINGIEVGVNRVGITFPFMLSCPTDGWKTDDIVEFFATDIFGHMCKASYTVADCGCCPAETPFVLDDASTADTIVKNSTIEVYVLGGCPPFTFATSSLGYTFEGVTSFETEDRNATLECVDGTCGVEFVPGCLFTITDSCGTVVSSGVRNTSGSWHLMSPTQLSCGRAIGGSSTYYSIYSTDKQIRITGAYIKRTDYADMTVSCTTLSDCLTADSVFGVSGAVADIWAHFALPTIHGCKFAGGDCLWSSTCENNADAIYLSITGSTWDC
jgi:hypothetical protein